MAREYLRWCSVIVAPTAGGDGIELVAPSTPAGDALHVTFQVRNVIVSTPHWAWIRVYNVADSTAQKISQLGGGIALAEQWRAGSNGQVILKAGYGGNYGTIFQGAVRQIKTGRENPTDTYLDIYAADGDWARNWGFANVTLAAGYSQAQVVKAMHSFMTEYGTTLGSLPEMGPSSDRSVPVTPPPKSPRGRALWGPVRQVLQDVAKSHDNTWSLNSNRLEFLPTTAYAPGDAVVLNSQSGMIGLPQLTADGVRVRCLLNPSVGVGSRIQIDQKSLQQPSISLESKATNRFPSTNADGLYKVLTVDHHGDNRGQNWYTDIVAIDADPSSNRLPLNLTGHVVHVPD